jgi:hypothetical protein
MRQRCHDQDPVTVTHAQMLAWAARLIRLPIEDEQNWQIVAGVAMEMKAVADNTITVQRWIGPHGNSILMKASDAE